MTAQLTHSALATSTQTAAPAAGGPFRRAWHQVRLTVAEMNYAARRAAELQAPWAVDAQWHTR
jgi:hypothetical protein